MAAHHNISADQFGQQSLFDTEPYTAKQNYDPKAWAGNPQTVWHGSGETVMPQDTSSQYFGSGFHVGTLHAAHEAERYQSNPPDVGRIYPLHMGGQTLVSEQLHPGFGEVGQPQAVQTDSAANGDSRLSHGQFDKADEAITAGQNIPYQNMLEDSGSVSFRAPRSNLHTWREDVMSDSNAPTRHKAVAEYGYDLSISRADTDRSVSHSPAFPQPGAEEDARKDGYWDEVYGKLPSPKLRRGGR